ncbi:MAG TPA: Asp-tRNA(Asn)/Glu-tRNA(Gln) amidotransferase subunit GatB [Opitutaceae bacterium]|jgi:aspartyl-tRNA(Asn)/glutamyl-tRNA(Gln) amidotransferase subunit B|nr:Asp-tRNA(Asn)/Glu-tRNA(Gln) amidotransferase subunit GatB [Opitutaceae bacterium]
MSAPGEITYEAVIGLEVHVQVKTRSKMFSRVEAAYGRPENTLTDPVVLALPGALPVMNRAALDQTVKAGLLLGCEIAPVCKWDRKNYFYPDSPKNYQISQYDQPICLGGSVEIELPGAARNVMGEHKKIPLTRIHLEEDVGKLNHGAGGSLIDFNRAGTPLMEIVSEPALRSPEEAFAYLSSLKTTMIYGGISDCDMEKGQLRCDANVSLRPAGETKLGVKVELKNLNSISFVRDGIAHEIKRQAAVLRSGGAIVQETRDYDGQAGTSQPLRSKEMAHDYRYFPDPDLMPVQVDAAWKERIRAECPELPFDKQRRFLDQYQIPYTLTSVLIPDRELSDLFEELAAPTEAQAAGNWIVNTGLQLINEGRTTPADIRRKKSDLVKLIQGRLAGTIQSSEVAGASAALLTTAATFDAWLEGRGANAVDTGELEQWCRQAIAENPKSLADFKAGKESAINGFKGSVMRAARGKADPKRVDETLRRLLAGP